MAALLARSLLSTALLLVVSAAWAQPRLKQVRVDGKQYYAAYRVCSKARGACVTNTANRHRFMPSDNVWQYGSGFYLFTSVKDARKFIDCSKNGMAHLLVKDPRTRVNARDTILEVLLPKERFDRLAKGEVRRDLDWASQPHHPRHEQYKSLQQQSDVLFGRWREDPQRPFAAYKPLVGTPQLAVVKTGEGSILEHSLVRLVQSNQPRPAPATRTPPPQPKKRQRVTFDRSLPRPQRVEALVQANRARHTGLHQLLDGRLDRHQGRKAIEYLKSNFADAKRYFPRESGTWEGFTIHGHTLRAYNLLANQIKHVDLERMNRAYPRVNLRRTLQLALLLHDVGKPVAIDKARQLVDTTLAQGKELDQLDRSKLRPHSTYSSSIMSRTMWQLGCNADEIRLARALVSSNALGQLVQEKTNMTGAADQLRTHAARAGLAVKDYFALQTLFFAADAGAYRSLRRGVFERRSNGQLVPFHPRFQMLGYNLGAD